MGANRIELSGFADATMLNHRSSQAKRSAAPSPKLPVAPRRRIQFQPTDRSADLAASRSALTNGDSGAVCGLAGSSDQPNEADIHGHDVRRRGRPEADLGQGRRCRSAASPYRTFMAPRSNVQDAKVRSADFADTCRMSAKLLEWLTRRPDQTVFYRRARKRASGKRTDRPGWVV